MDDIWMSTIPNMDTTDPSSLPINPSMDNDPDASKIPNEIIQYEITNSLILRENTILTK